MNSLRVRGGLAASAPLLIAVALGACSSERTVTEPLGCGYGTFGGSCDSGPTFGFLASTATSGAPAGNSPYTVRVSRDGCAITHQIGRNEPGKYLTACGEGTNMAELRDLPQGCAVDGANARTVEVQASSWPRVHFAVHCS